MPQWLIGFDEAVEVNQFKPKLNKRHESIWDNLNFQVIWVLAVKGFVEFLLLGCLGYFLVMLINALS